MKDLTMDVRIKELDEDIVKDEEGTHTVFHAVLQDKDTGVKIRVTRPTPFEGLTPGQTVSVAIRNAQTTLT